MNRELKRVSTVVLLMFVSLFISSSVIQVVTADSLQADGRNVRTLYASYSAERGPILVDGEPIALSQPVDDEFKFLRVYPKGELYAPITGYLTLNQGNTGLEDSLNDYLSGSSNDQFFDQVNSILTGQNPTGAAVELTIDPVVQQAAWDALGDYTGAVVAIKMVRTVCVCGSVRSRVRFNKCARSALWCLKVADMPRRPRTGTWLFAGAQ